MLGFGNFGYGKRKNDTEYPQPQNNESGAAQQSPSPRRQGENDERRGGANDYIAKRNNEIRMQAEAFKMVNPAFNMAAVLQIRLGKRSYGRGSVLSYAQERIRGRGALWRTISAVPDRS